MVKEFTLNWLLFCSHGVLSVEKGLHSHHRWDGGSTYSSGIYRKRRDFHCALRLLHSSVSSFSSDDGKSKVELAVEAKAKKEKNSETTEVSVVVCTVILSHHCA